MNSKAEEVIARLERLEAENAELKADFHRERAQTRCERRRLRVQAGLAFAAFIAAIVLSPANRRALAQGYGVTLASLNTRLLAVEGKTQFLSANATAKTTTLTGCNVYIQSGSGSTSDGAFDNFNNPTGGALTGLGNLIIGYNSQRGGDVRTGSHNLILGDFNNYSRFGGIIAGVSNEISAPYACVTGGTNNKATGPFCSVIGGQVNTASSIYDTVTGGLVNTANGGSSSVSGGAHNLASGGAASISGGIGNTASGTNASVSGGGSAFGGVVQSSGNGWAAGGTGAGTFHSP